MTDYPKSGIKMPGTIKAGCGIRFDPDDLTEDTGFDFSAAEALKPEDQAPESEAPAAEASTEDARPAASQPSDTP